MSDDNMPYEKAIEETAKATSNAVDLIREGGRAIGPVIGEAYGLLIGDKISAARVRHLDQLARKTKKILNDRDVADQQEPPENIAIPLFEAAQGESREEIQELWARLLANAMDPERSNNVRTQFIATVRRLDPIDAKILLQLRNSPYEAKWPTTSQIAVSLSLRDTAIEVSVTHLADIGCVLRHGSDKRSINLSPYGRELLYGLES